MTHLKISLASFLCLLIITPAISEAQHGQVQYAPSGKVKCEYWKMKIKDQDACLKQARTFNSMTDEQKGRYNQQVRDYNAERDRKAMIYQLQDINRKINNRR